MGRHRLERVRPRYGRMLSASCALAVTLVAVGGGLGGVGGSADRPGGAMPVASAGLAVSADLAPDNTNAADATDDGAATSSAPPSEAVKERRRARREAAKRSEEEAVDRSAARSTALPAGSGEGRRVVFSESAQRVWLVGEGDEVQRTYLVSGSVYDNLDPGTYSVYSRSEQAWGIDNSGTMKYFVRFTRGENAAIGFHDIPEQGGAPVQTLDELGTPLSHGCIRQKREDAIALWEFAPLGTTVVVVD